MEGAESGKKHARHNGVAVQLLGVTLLSLGLLNAMLTLKAGLEPDWFNYILAVSGTVLLISGIWQSR